MQHEWFWVRSERGKGYPLGKFLCACLRKSLRKNALRKFPSQCKLLCAASSAHITLRKLLSASACGQPYLGGALARKSAHRSQRVLCVTSKSCATRFACIKSCGVSTGPGKSIEPASARLQVRSLADHADCQGPGRKQPTVKSLPARNLT